jgi:large subunit ribosomal protein L23
MDYTQILRKPVVTEKSTDLKDEYNQVAFFVADKANKIEIKRAVEEAFQVNVLGVKIVRVKPRLKKRFGRVLGRKTGYKKAYIQLSPEDKINYFEGV